MGHADVDNSGRPGQIDLQCLGRRQADDAVALEYLAPVGVLDGQYETALLASAGADIAGIAVHIASRIAALAKPNEVLVSRTVLDLTAGSRLQFEPRGEHELKGVPGTWPTFSAHATG